MSDVKRSLSSVWTETCSLAEWMSHSRHRVTCIGVCSGARVCVCSRACANVRVMAKEGGVPAYFQLPVYGARVMVSGT